MIRAALVLVLLASTAPATGHAQVPMGDVPVRVEGDLVIATALGLVPDGDASLAARRLSARSTARERATAMLHAWLDGVVRAGSLSPRVVRDLHAAIDAHLDMRRIRSRADGSAVIELVVPVAELRAVHCPASGAAALPWCG